MKESLIIIIIEFLKRHLMQKRWRRAATCMAAVVVFCTTYLLMLPAISMTKSSISLSAETLSAWSGDPLSVRVNARAEEDEDGKIFTLLTHGTGAELSETYVFDEGGICVITDEDGREIELHRVYRGTKKFAPEEDITADYWFTLEAGEHTAFTLELSDKVDKERFLQAAEAVKNAAEEAEAAAEPEKQTDATASDADRKEEKKEQKKEPEKATGSNGQRAAAVSVRAASVSDAVRPEETEEEDGFVQLLDGEILNDLAEDKADENEEPTEIVAFLELTAGSGTDLGEAVKDAEKNAEKRGDGLLKFTWKDIAESGFITPEMVWFGDGAQVAVIFDGDAKLPADAVLSVEEIEPGTAEYAAYLEQAVNAVRASGSDATKEMGVDYARFFDICILNGEGVELEPAAPVKVVITYDEAVSVGSGGDLNVMHFHEENTPEVLETEKAEIIRDIPADQDGGKTAGAVVDVDALSFTAERFSVFGIVRTAIEKLILASDGQTYRVSVSCGAGSGVPEGAELQVAEITEDSSEYAEYVSKAESALDLEEGSASYVRLFDIKIVDENGEKVEITAPVDVTVSLADMKIENSSRVLHFADGAEQPEVLPDVDITKDTSKGSGMTLSFAAEGFSVYAIVDGPEPVTPEVRTVATLAELASVVAADAQAQPPKETPFFFSYASGANLRYFTNSVNNNGALVENKNSTSASEWYFETSSATNEYRIYTYVDGTKNYLVYKPVPPNELNNIGLQEEPDTVFELTQAADGLFYFKQKGADRWLQHSGSGSGIRFYTDNNNATNSRITITYADSFKLPDDVYSLNNKSYGIAYHNNEISAAAMSAEEFSGGLSADAILIRENLWGDKEGIYLVSGESDIAEWTFVSVREDVYLLKTGTGADTRYLKISSDGKVSLADSEDDASEITVLPGTGANSGRIRLKSGSYYLNLNGGKAANGFNAVKTAGGTTWMNLLQKSPNLTNDDFVIYQAKKVSVSQKHIVYRTDDNGDPVLDDEGNPVPLTETVNVLDDEGNPVVDDEGNPVTKEVVVEEYDMPDGAQVIIYTRIWNDAEKKYDFYAVDHDGSLFRCRDAGDEIEWVGSSANTALWEFDDRGNNYYSFQNLNDPNNRKPFLVPQMPDKILYESTVPAGQMDFNASVNMNGRKYGKNYTKIVAWDDSRYAYSGLKTENGRIVPCALAEAEDFYFAIIQPSSSEDRLTEVETVDSAQYGITMKMVDFNNSIVNSRDSLQTSYFGYDTNTKGLLSTNLGEDGYPVITAEKAEDDKKGKSLRELFTYDPDNNPLTEVNHLFIESIYNESGYFEYSSTQNFARLNGGDFTVYDQIAAIDNVLTKTRTHGQFMPYNELREGHYSTATNMTDVLGDELPDTDPRKREKLYLIDKGNADYFFGMEMSAGFTQTADGLDDWKHDIIFEFSGDDDFWLYVDEELVLDIGGVHSASIGKINFRTGKVELKLRNAEGAALADRTRTTDLKTIFEENYAARGLSQEEIADKIADIFTQKTITEEDGTTSTVYVFKDYSYHTMRMFYMERGAGASNLHMRFNLAAVKPGSFILSKKLAGEGVEEENDLIDFAYQIFYKTEQDGERDPYHLLGANDGEAEKVLYKGTILPVTYHGRYHPEGSTQPYEHVFILHPGQSAEVALPDGTTEYYVVECGVDPDVYEHVYANTTELTGTPSEGFEGRKDYRTSAAGPKDRQAVDYVNEVAPGAMRTLLITKRLYDKDGTTLLHYDPRDGEQQDLTRFDFRLYLGNENADPDKIPEADQYSYFVKNRDGEYCRWSEELQKFQSLGISEYEGANGLSAYLSTLTNSQKENIVFKTSQFGSITRIPADYTVEVRSLIVGTRWKVEERETEIPKGYTLRQGDGYTRVYEDHEETTHTTPISGKLVLDETPDIEVRNQKGWGLTVEKVWTDKDFMELHDPIYFAVYLTGDGTGGQEPSLLEGSVRELRTTESSIYYFFDDLQSGIPFDRYAVFEVTLTGDNITVDDKGRVSGYESVTPIPEGGTLHIGGQPVHGSYRPADPEDSASGYTYTVTYTQGEPTYHNENVRTDTVKNSRPGIELYKVDVLGEKLADAVFTLKEADGTDVGAPSYRSRGEDGQITIAYLGPGTYTLTETVPPRGYVGLNEAMTITVGDDDSIDVSGPDPALYKLDRTGLADDMIARITIKNRPAALKAVKVDAEAPNPPLSGVKFDLYAQQTYVNPDGTQTKGKAKDPMQGFTGLTTGADGVIPKITFTDLLDGTYYLTETEVPADYDLQPVDLCFTLLNGTVTINSAGEPAPWLAEETDTTGHDPTVTYVIKIPNQKMKRLSFKKVDVASPDSSSVEGAEFDLYRVVNGQREASPWKRGLKSNSEGMLQLNGETVFALPAGTYHLVETREPEGYRKLTEAVEIVVNANGPSYDDGTSYSQSGAGIETTVLPDGTTLYTLNICNGKGVSLPSTGGPGTRFFTTLGVLLAAGAGVLFLLRSRRRRMN